MTKGPCGTGELGGAPGPDSNDATPALPTRSLIVERLRLAREMVGLSQGQVAKLMGMHRPTVSEIEAGRRRIGAEELREFARHYHTTVGWLSGEEPESADLNHDSIKLAAKELGKLSPDDLQRVLRVIGAIRSNRSDVGSETHD